MALILASACFTQLAFLSIPACFYIDRIGRRWSVMLSSGACSICMIIVASTLTNQTYASSAAAVAFIFLYLDCWTGGILPVSRSYSAEIQPLRARNKATAVGVFAHWMSNFVVVWVTPIWDGFNRHQLFLDLGSIQCPVRAACLGFRCRDRRTNLGTN